MRVRACVHIRQRIIMADQTGNLICIPRGVRMSDKAGHALQRLVGWDAFGWSVLTRLVDWKGEM